MCGSGAVVVSQGKHSRGPTREGRSGDKIYLQHHIKNQKSIPPGFPISYLFIPPWKIRARNRANVQGFCNILKLTPLEPIWSATDRLAVTLTWLHMVPGIILSQAWKG